MTLASRVMPLRPEPKVWVQPSLSAAARNLTLGWLCLAVWALVLSGVFAFLVAIARTPLVELVAGRDYLYTALVAHVTFALNVWLLSFAAALWVIVAARLGAPLPARPAWVSLALGWVGTILLAAVPLVGWGAPVMADYVPTLEHPLFYLGLSAYISGVCVTAVCFLTSLLRRRSGLPLEAQALGLSACAYLGAIASFVLVGVKGEASDYASLVWGGGHLFQVVNSAALVAAWWMAAPGNIRACGFAVRVSFIGFVIALAAVELFSVTALPWDFFAPVFWAGLAVPVVTAWLVTARILYRWHKDTGLSLVEVSPLFFSLALYGVGGLIALTGMENDTRVTAHYHGVVGAVTVMFMGLTYRIFSWLGVGIQWKRVVRLQPYVYGSGLLLLIAGMFWAGEVGATRKTFEAIPKDPSLLAASAFIGIGALTTVVGGGAFVLAAGRSLLGELSYARPSARSRASMARADQMPIGS